MVRSLLARGNIPKRFWPEAVNWSIHVLNRSPTFAVQNMTLKEAWSGRRPAVDHFKIFGCIAYAHVLDEKRKKLDEKRENCVFLGVSEHFKAYKLFNPITEKIITNRDMVFDEENMWDWTRKCKELQQIRVDFDGIENMIEIQQHQQPLDEHLPVLQLLHQQMSSHLRINVQGKD
ncbi:hypothetical protein CsSME_00036854 [Camellia sinensis var. sinensis]